MALTTQYDPIFRRHAGRIPVAYLRALGQRESGLRPDVVMPGGTGAARGLLQVVGVVRQDYNQRHGTAYTPDDLLDPDINVKIAADLLNRIVGYLGKHPSANLKADWTNPEFVKLFTAAWNAGFSEAAGVGKVASYLEARNIPVTHDSVYEHAAAAGGVIYLQKPERRTWQRSVADLYFLQPDRRGPGSGIVTLLLVALAGWGAYQFFRTS